MDHALARALSQHPFQAELSCGRSVRPLPGEDAECALTPGSWASRNPRSTCLKTGSSWILQVLARAECPGTGVVCRLRSAFLQAHNAKSYLVLKPMNSNTCPHLLSFR